jgi:hypothetical protein
MFISIMRMSTTFTTSSRVGFGPSTNKTLSPYIFRTQNSNEMYVGVMKSTTTIDHKTI